MNNSQSLLVGDAISGMGHMRGQMVEFVSTTPSPRRRFSQNIVCNLLAAGEALLICAVMALLLAGSPRPQAMDGRFVLIASFMTGTIALLGSIGSGSASAAWFASRMALLPCAIVTALSGFFFAKLGGMGWLHSFLCAASLFVAIYLVKFLSLQFKAWLQDRGHLSRMVAVAANDPVQRQALVELLRTREDIEIVFVGAPAALEMLDQLVRSDRLDEIVLAGHEEREEDIAALMGLAVTLVRVTPQDRVLYRKASVRWARKRIFGPWDAPAAIIATPPLTGWNATIKRAMDIFGALLALMLFGPIMLATALAIRLESAGPALFVQERIGYRNKSFRMYKFRSMRSDQADKNGSQLTLRNDPRVTRVGAFIRRTSIDELPQLFNVLIGNMSLVGPRPHPKAAKAGSMLYDDLIPEFYSRYRMKPGITGLAQVQGLRGNTETEQHLIDRFGSDLQYAAEWTPLLDIAIILRTAVHLFSGTNAF